MPQSKYQAILYCNCGYNRELSDIEYQDILEDRKDLQDFMGCGHWKFGAKITAKHKIDKCEWCFGYGSDKDDK